MFKWIHHLLNPHCPDCREERENSKVCPSCEILKYEIERLRAENDRLLSKIIKEPESAPAPRLTGDNMQEIRPHRVPWAVRRQMLEAEDRKKAQLLASAPTPESTSTEDLEKELGVVERERESNVSGKK